MVESMFLQLPLELVVLIMKSVGGRELIQLRSTCRDMRDLLREDRSPGKEIWRDVRTTMGAPDPSLIGKTNMRLINDIFRRGCDGCHEHPLIRKSIWEFGGIRLCRDCFNQFTERDYIYNDPSHYRGLPYIQSEGVSQFGQSYVYRSYLKLHLRDRAHFAGLYNRLDVARFKTEMKAYHLVQAQKVESIRNKRRGDIDAYLGKHLPVGSVWWRSHPVYTMACKRPLPLTDTAARRLLAKLGQPLPISLIT